MKTLLETRAILDTLETQHPGADTELHYQTPFQLLVATVEAERQCCRFLRFDISVEPDGGPLWLSLSGPLGTRDFLSAPLEA